MERTEEGAARAERIARDLHAVLAAASEAPPFVMVGHSLGGLFIRVYDAQFPGEVAGFVFIDASHPDQDNRFPAEMRAMIQARKSERDQRWLFKILAPYRIFTGERPTPRTAYWWRSFPDGVLVESREIDVMSEQAARTGSLGDRPVIVLTAGVALDMPGVSDDVNAEVRRVWLELQSELAALSTDSDHRIVEGAGHYIHWNRPEAAITAISDVVDAVRNGASLPPAADQPSL